MEQNKFSTDSGLGCDVLKIEVDPDMQQCMIELMVHWLIVLAIRSVRRA